MLASVEAKRRTSRIRQVILAIHQQRFQHDHGTDLLRQNPVMCPYVPRRKIFARDIVG